MKFILALGALLVQAVVSAGETLVKVAPDTSISTKDIKRGPKGGPRGGSGKPKGPGGKKGGFKGLDVNTLTPEQKTKYETFQAAAKAWREVAPKPVRSSKNVVPAVRPAVQPAVTADVVPAVVNQTS